MKDIFLPEMGEGIENVEISELLVSIGDKINTNDPLILVESEKASMEIPSTEAGIIKNIYVKKGDTIKAGSPIILIMTSNKSKENIEHKSIVNKNNKLLQKDPVKINKIETNPLTKIITSGHGVIASPSVRRFARELGCDLKQVRGTSSKGRISKEDVQQYVKTILNKNTHNTPFIAPDQKIDFSKWGKIEVKSLNKIKRLTGSRLQYAWQTIPHVTQFDNADITKLEELRSYIKKTNNLKLSIISFLVKALNKILKEMPIFNSSLDPTNENLILKQYIKDLTPQMSCYHNKLQSF